MESPDAAIIEELLSIFKQFTSVLDKHPEGRDYVTGDFLTVADLRISTILPNADKAKPPISNFANIACWHDKLMALPAWEIPWHQTQSEAA